jgi:hypothetical protein
VTRVRCVNATGVTNLVCYDWEYVIAEEYEGDLCTLQEVPGVIFMSSRFEYIESES